MTFVTSAMLELKVKKIYALCDCLYDVAFKDVTASAYCDHTFYIHDREYLVLTDKEANERAKDSISETLWAFNTGFLMPFLNFSGELSLSELNAIEKAIARMQEELCESANPIIRALIGANFPAFVAEAIKTCGRGQLLAPYDHEELEAGDFYVYRMN